MDSPNQATREILGMEQHWIANTVVIKQEKQSENCLIISHTFALAISYK